VPLVGEAGEYLARVHPEFDYLQSYTAADGFALLGQVHGAHTPFTQRSKDVITAKVVVTGCHRQCNDRLSSDDFGANGTIESTLYQTVWA
jgi:hypothetical protein